MATWEFKCPRCGSHIAVDDYDTGEIGQIICVECRNPELIFVGYDKKSGVDVYELKKLFLEFERLVEKRLERLEALVDVADFELNSKKIEN